MTRLSITSEIGKLRSIIMHCPGEEIRRMPPAMRQQLLYDDILYVDLARREHDAFRKLMSLVTTPDRVFEVRDLLIETLADEDVRRSLISDVCLLDSAPDAVRYALLDMEPVALADHLLAGYERPRQHASLAGALSNNPYSLTPIPNLMFMRDPGVVVGNGVILGHMFWPARQREPLLMRYIFTRHPAFAAGGAEPPLWFDRLSPELIARQRRVRDPHTIEGGDVLVVRPDLLLIGCSERTSIEGIDLLAQEMRRQGGPAATIYAVMMPKQRRMMHLDTIFTFLSRDEVLVYPPLILPGGGEQVGIVRIHRNASGEIESTPMRKSLVACLEEELGRPLHAIPCGGSNRLYQDREQWTDGANSFALRPGLILGYERNEETFTALQAAGFKLIKQEDLIAWESAPDEPGGGHWCENAERSAEIRDHPERKYAIMISGLELSRARGGPRCMTMPLEREPYEM